MIGQNPSHATVPLTESIHSKKRLSFSPSPAGRSLTKFSQTGNNLIISGQEDTVKKVIVFPVLSRDGLSLPGRE